jgi:elongation factor P hydroxylase
MNTAIQELIHFIENDRMQSSYTKEQVLELLTFKLEKEKEQIMKARQDIFHTGNLTNEQYYSETFK